MLGSQEGADAPRPFDFALHMPSLARALPLFIALASLEVGCGVARTLPDYDELLVAGVDPPAEAERVIAFLARAEFELVERVEAGPVIALGFRRARDEHRAVRVVTRRGVSVVLDSHAEDGITVSAGAIELDAARSGGDLDADGRTDLLVVRPEAHRTCLLILEVDDEGEVAPLTVDARDLDPSVCLESLRDVNGDGVPEALVALYAHGLARTRLPRAELPLERDEAGIYRRTPPAVSFLEAEVRRIDGALVLARQAEDPEACFTLAVERALLAFAAGRALDAQLEAFDRSIASTVWPERFSPILAETRRAIANGRW